LDRIAEARPIFIYNAEPPERAGSIALQALIPARHLGAKALYFGAGMDPEAFLDRHAPKVLILTKAFDDGPLTLAVAAARRGIRIIAVYCDLHAGNEFAIRNTALSQMADRIVAPTRALALIIQEQLGRPCEMIEEPVENLPGTPLFSPRAPLRMVWCGHASNHDTLPHGLKALARFPEPISLRIVSGLPPDTRTLRNIAPNIDMTFLPWSPMIQFDAIAQSDIVFIPSLDRLDKFSKGQARLVSAIQAGRVAIAHPLPQYLELTDYCLCDRDYLKALETALADPEAAVARVTAGQRYIAGRFAPEVCADKWGALISSLL
jgi:hypothetical protein